MSIEQGSMPDASTDQNDNRQEIPGNLSFEQFVEIVKGKKITELSEEAINGLRGIYDKRVEEKGNITKEFAERIRELQDFIVKDEDVL